MCVCVAGAVDENGRMPFYAEECASMLAVTFSSGGSKLRSIVGFMDTHMHMHTHTHTHTHSLTENKTKPQTWMNCGINNNRKAGSQ